MANKIDAGEWMAISGAALALLPVARRAVQEVRDAQADWLTPDEVRGIVLRALGLPETLPPGPVFDLIATIVRALED